MPGRGAIASSVGSQAASATRHASASVVPRDRKRLLLIPSCSCSQELLGSPRSGSAGTVYVARRPWCSALGVLESDHHGSVSVAMLIGVTRVLMSTCVAPPSRPANASVMLRVGVTLPEPVTWNVMSQTATLLPVTRAMAVGVTIWLVTAHANVVVPADPLAPLTPPTDWFDASADTNEIFELSV